MKMHDSLKKEHQSVRDRRSGKERRKNNYFRYVFPDRRSEQERRGMNRRFEVWFERLFLLT